MIDDHTQRSTRHAEPTQLNSYVGPHGDRVKHREENRRNNKTSVSRFRRSSTHGSRAWLRHFVRLNPGRWHLGRTLTSGNRANDRRSLASGPLVGLGARHIDPDGPCWCTASCVGHRRAIPKWRAWVSYWPLRPGFPTDSPLPPPSTRRLFSKPLPNRAVRGLTNVCSYIYLLVIAPSERDQDDRI